MSAAVKIDATATVADTAVVGAAPRQLLTGERPAGGPTFVGPECWIGEQCVVGAGARLGAGTVLDHATRVGPGAQLGSRVLLTHRGHVDAEAEVGPDTIVAGFVAERSVVGARCRVFGDLIHRQHDPRAPWDDDESAEPSPVLEDDAFVGWGACVIGGVRLGAAAYIAAGAIVTRDVPPRHVVTGVNHAVPLADWPGALSPPARAADGPPG